MSVIDELSPYIRAYPEAFRTARARCGLTNEELSERSGVPYSTVRNAQSGNGGVTIVQAAALARVLGLSIDEMFGAVKPEAEQQRAELEQRDPQSAGRQQQPPVRVDQASLCAHHLVLAAVHRCRRLPHLGLSPPHRRSCHRRQYVSGRVVRVADCADRRLRHGPLPASYILPVYQAVPHRFHRSRAGR